VTETSLNSSADDLLFQHQHRHQRSPREPRHVSFADPICQIDDEKTALDERAVLTPEVRAAYLYTVCWVRIGACVFFGMHNFGIRALVVSLCANISRVTSKQTFISPASKNHLFSQTADLELFQKDCTLTALMYVKQNEVGIPWEEANYSIRGIEDMIRRHQNNNKSIRAEHSARVLAEQTRHVQQTTAINNSNINSSGSSKSDGTVPMVHPKDALVLSERLRTVSCSSSKGERLRAMHRAREDAIGQQQTSLKRFTMQRMRGSMSLK
jgi:hypothetical protein